MDATEAEGKTTWQGLAGKVETVALHNTIIENMKTMWKMKKDVIQHCPYHVSYHHSKVTADYSTNCKKSSQWHWKKNLLIAKQKNWYGSHDWICSDA